MSSTTTTTTLNTAQVNPVQCVISIFPYEGGSVQLSESNAGLLSVSVTKGLYSQYQTAEIVLAPGGPDGTAANTWSGYITPQSFCTIGMVRGGSAQMLLAGIVTSIREDQQWQAAGARRVTVIEVSDIGYLLARESYFSLPFLLGLAQSTLGAAGILSLQSMGTAGGLSPAQTAAAFYQQIIAGTSSAAAQEGAVFSTTTFNVNNQKTPFRQIIGTWFQEYSYPGVDIPYASDWLGTSESWSTKLGRILEQPYYELFTDTAPATLYPDASTADSVFDSSGKFPSSRIFLIGRVCPLPVLTNTGTPQNPAWGLNTDLWQPLFDARYVLQPGNFLSSSLEFSADDAKNIYGISPTNVIGMNGGSNGNLSPFVATQALWWNQNSLARYGFSPCIVGTSWFFDPSGLAAQKLAAQGGNADTLSGLYQDLLLRLISFYNGLPLMGRGTVTMPLQPTINIGQVMEWSPYKGGESWVGYIEGVHHEYSLGGASTTVTLGRCLPTSIYQNTPLLVGVLTGNASRFESEYVLNASSDIPGLTAMTLGSAAAVNTSFSTPQPGPQPTN